MRLCFVSQSVYYHDCIIAPCLVISTVYIPMCRRGLFRNASKETDFQQRFSGGRICRGGGAAWTSVILHLCRRKDEPNFIPTDIASAGTPFDRLFPKTTRATFPFADHLFAVGLALHSALVLQDSPLWRFMPLMPPWWTSTWMVFPKSERDAPACRSLR